MSKRADTEGLREAITKIREEAGRILRASAEKTQTKAIAERSAQALADVLDAMIRRRAVELGVSPDDISIDDVLVSDDDRAIPRLYMKALVAANTPVEAKLDDTMELTVGRLALERGWSIIDAARAILDSPESKVDQIRDTATHSQAKRIHRTVKQVVLQRLKNIEAHLDLLEHGSPLEAMGVLLPAAFISVFAGLDITPDQVADGLRGERDRLRALLESGARRTNVES